MSEQLVVVVDGSSDLAGKLIDYETGQMSDDEIIALFQDLVDTGLAWQLQGHYGRTAAALLDAGLIERR